jgi:hypothetical protein
LPKKNLLLCIALLLSFASELWAAPPSPTPGTLIIANQASTRVIVAPYANSTTNSGTLLFPFADGITFIGTGSSYTTFTGTIVIVLHRAGGSLTDTIGSIDTSGAYTHPSPASTTSLADLPYTLTFTGVANATVETALKKIFYKCSGNSVNAQNRTLWIFVKETNNPAFLSIGNEYHYYTRNPGTNFWNEALDNAGNALQNPYCYGLKGYLATVLDISEETAVRTASASNGYLGANETSGSWKWYSGPETGATLSYFNWQGGEPNNNGGPEDYLETTNLGWNDLSNQSIGYFVEYGGYYTGTASVAFGNLNYVNIRVLSPNSLAPAAGF